MQKEEHCMESMNDQSLPGQSSAADDFSGRVRRYRPEISALFSWCALHAAYGSFLCHYYTTKRPLCVEFIDFPALLYDKIRGLNLGLCLQPEEAFYAPFFYQYREPPVIWLLLRSYIRRHTHTQMNQGPEPVPESPRRLNR